jgi:hypothetical protein
VSRLQTRLERLEQQLPPCRDCAERRIQVELVSPQEVAVTRARPDPICPSCGEPGERILVLLSFDPDAKATR